MSKRKTIEISEIVARANNMLASSVNCSQDARLAICSFVESILHKTNNYRGFAYLSQREVPEGYRPGINCDENGPLEDMEARFANCDDTRRKYIG